MLFMKQEFMFLILGEKVFTEIITWRHKTIIILAQKGRVSQNGQIYLGS